jgi:hypothetical protein
MTKNIENGTAIALLLLGTAQHGESDVELVPSQVE